MNDQASMTLEEACELAKRIRADHARITVRAIGRFVPIDQLATTSERWGVSIALPDGKQTVIWSTLALAMLVSPEKPAPRRQSKSRSNARDRADERQEVLF